MASHRDTPFEQEMRRNPELMLQEAGNFFMERGILVQTLRHLTRHLEQASIPYAVIGAIALSRYGLVRMTLDIDILLSPEGLEKFKTLYLGRGYVAAFPGAQKTFRAADTGVRIEVVTAGGYPGDGKPKAVRFPDPAEAATEIGGISLLPLERFLELKLASGLTAPHRRRDLADVQDLIRTLGLSAGFAERLDLSVQAVFRELWQEAQAVDPLQEE